MYKRLLLNLNHILCQPLGAATCVTHSSKNIFSSVWQTKPHPELVRFRQTLRQMCIAQFMLVPRTSSYEEDDAPNLLDFLRKLPLY